MEKTVCVYLFLRFIKAASLQGLVQEEPNTTSLCKAITEASHSDLLMDCTSGDATFTNAGWSDD